MIFIFGDSFVLNFSRPNDSFFTFMGPLTMLRYLIWEPYKFCLLKGLVVALLLAILGLFLYSMPVSSLITYPFDLKHYKRFIFLLTCSNCDIIHVCIYVLLIDVTLFIAWKCMCFQSTVTALLSGSRKYGWIFWFRED